MAISSKRHLANLELIQGKPDQAAPRLRNAQQLAQLLLPPDHPFHAIIAQTVAEGALILGCCSNCLVNQARYGRAALHGSSVLGLDESESGEDCDSENEVHETDFDSLFLYICYSKDLAAAGTS